MYSFSVVPGDYLARIEQIGLQYAIRPSPFPHLEKGYRAKTKAGWY